MFSFQSIVAEAVEYVGLKTLAQVIDREVCVPVDPILVIWFYCVNM